MWLKLKSEKMKLLIAHYAALNVNVKCQVFWQRYGKESIMRNLAYAERRNQKQRGSVNPLDKKGPSLRRVFIFKKLNADRINRIDMKKVFGKSNLAMINKS
jgi:hypothetical protein